MRNIPIDIHGILDKCSECLNYAGFIYKQNKKQYAVGCSVCANSIDFENSKDRAMCKWNIEQRIKLKKIV
jgi:hypothetical protein